MLRLCTGVGLAWGVAATAALLTFLWGSMLIGNPYFQDASASLRLWAEFAVAGFLFGYAWAMSLLRFWPMFLAGERIRFFYRAGIFLSGMAGLMLGLLAGQATKTFLTSSLFFTVCGGVTGAWITGACLKKIRLDPHLAARYPVPEAVSVLVTFAFTSACIWALCSPLSIMILLQSKVAEGSLSLSDMWPQLLYAAGFSWLSGAVYGLVAFALHTKERSGQIRGVPLAERIKRMGFFLGLATSAKHVSIVLCLIAWLFVGEYLNRYVLEPEFHAGAVVGLGSAVVGLPASSGPIIAEWLVTRSPRFRRLIVRLGAMPVR